MADFHVGILAIQGDFEAHARAVDGAGGAPRRVLRADEIDACDAVVLPGGESTTISKGIDRLALWQPLRAFVDSGRPVFGTCAGAILAAREVENDPVPTLGVLDLCAVRNAYGTQVDSFAAPVDPGSAFDAFHCVFIRAPRLRALGPAVEVLATVRGEPVLVRQGNVWAATFHPELTDDVRVHAAALGLG